MGPKRTYLKQPLSKHIKEQPTEPIELKPTFNIEKVSLALRNPHPQDSRIRFDPEPHKYYWDGKEVKQSVTGLKKYFTSEFIPNISLNQLSSTMVDGKCILKSGEENQYHGKTLQQIRALWEEKKQRGTYVHSLIEQFLNIWPSEKPYPPRSDWMKIIKFDTFPPPVEQVQLLTQFFNFFEEVILKNNWEPYRTEWCIYIKEIETSGGIDAVFRKWNSETEEYDYALVDWKVISDSESTLKSSSERVTYIRNAYYPLEKYLNSKWFGFCLQLGLYDYGLRQLGYNVITKILVQLHPGKYTSTALEEKKLKIANAKGRKPRPPKIYKEVVYTIPFMRDEIDEVARVFKNNHLDAIKEWKIWKESGGVGGRQTLHPYCDFPIKEDINLFIKSTF